MEYSETLDENNVPELIITNEIKSFLSETAKWANFIAIVGFVFVGLTMLTMVGVLLFAGSMASELSTMSAGVAGIFPLIFYTIFMGIAFIPILYLYKFAQNMKRALKYDDSNALRESFMYMKSHYKFYGILTAIVTGIYVLIFLVALLGGAGALMG